MVRFEVVDRLLPLLERAARDGRTPLDVQDVLEPFAFDNICCVAFDHDPACLAEDEVGMAAPQSAEFMRAFNDVQDAVMARFMAPARSLWRVKRLLSLEPERRLREALATVCVYADRIVRNRGEAGHDFLWRSAASGEHSDEGLLDVVTNFIMAGRDTTSSALTWFFWLVSGRPDVEDKIVGEIRTVRTTSQGITTGAATFSFDELRHHRVHAAVPAGAHGLAPLRAGRLPVGRHVRRGRVAGVLFGFRDGAGGGHMGQ
ncbi:unnamed protein product [Miscanthus lutarioriparius]|uniref:Cytochrome P450 n=1 Tax=Miscanthus lutarioriparius TaxID=422564 RepID=A0A811QPI5_9POAL|nr:unnamed protein product [Miscanthus lutarioriparius]